MTENNGTVNKIEVYKSNERSCRTETNGLWLYDETRSWQLYIFNSCIYIYSEQNRAVSE